MKKRAAVKMPSATATPNSRPKYWRTATSFSPMLPDGVVRPWSTSRRTAYGSASVALAASNRNSRASAICALYGATKGSSPRSGPRRRDVGAAAVTRRSPQRRCQHAPRRKGHQGGPGDERDDEGRTARLGIARVGKGVPDACQHPDGAESRGDARIEIDGGQPQRRQEDHGVFQRVHLDAVRRFELDRTGRGGRGHLVLAARRTDQPGTAEEQQQGRQRD